MAPPILPPATLGVLGGGQLGKMFCAAAQRMGYAVAALDPDPEAPAMQCADHRVVGAFEDRGAVERLVELSDAVTLEFENVPADALLVAGHERPVRPGPKVLEIAQSRIAEKRFFQSIGIPTARTAFIASADDADAADEGLFPGLLKSDRMGYDGKHQHRVHDRRSVAGIVSANPQTAFVLERRLDLAGEIAVVGARTPSGSISMLPACETRHENGILDMAVVPARFDSDIRRQAKETARKIMEALEYEGVVCVEYFLTSDGELLANEMAPRPHNSGHHSIESCTISQFEMQVRALCDLPCPEPILRSSAAMFNLLGKCWDDGHIDWLPVLRSPRAAIHLYGKRKPRPWRKMGHVTFLAESPDEAESLALEAKAGLHGNSLRIHSRRA